MSGKSQYHGVVLLLFALMISGCSVGTVSLSVLQPARLELPAAIRSVSVISDQLNSFPEGTFDSIDNYRLEPDVDYNVTRNGYLYGLFDVMASSPRFVRVKLADSSVHPDFTGTDIPWDDIREICLNDSVNAVMVLHHAQSRDGLLTRSFPGVFCYVGYSILSESNWKIYIPSTLGTVDSLQVADTLKWDRLDVDCSYILDLLPPAGELLYESAYRNGYRTGMMICPHWQDNVMRILFTKGSCKLKTAARLVDKNNWHEAAQIWNRLSSVKNKSLASKASFNIALAYERDDELDQARMWIAYADSLKANRYSAAYRKIIDDRIKDREVLNRQMVGR